MAWARSAARMPSTLATRYCSGDFPNSSASGPGPRPGTHEGNGVEPHVLAGIGTDRRIHQTGAVYSVAVGFDVRYSWLILPEWGKFSSLMVP